MSETIKAKIKVAIENESVKRITAGLIASIIFVCGGVFTYLVGLSHFANIVLPTLDAHSEDISTLKQTIRELTGKIDNVGDKQDVANGKLEVILELIRNANSVK